MFNLAKQDVRGYDAYARQLATLFRDRPWTLEAVLDGLFHIAKADGVIHPRELEYLQSVAHLFGFGERDFERIAARHVMRKDAADPYTILGVPRSAGNEEVKRVYRKLVREHHPDRLIAQGVPEEFIQVATEKIARINEAYDRIAKERGL
jgi:DnaJ like chaperone protein